MEKLKLILNAHGIQWSQWQDAMASNERVVELKADNSVFWLKKAAPPRGYWRYRVLNLFSFLLRLPLLKAVPQPGGNMAIQNGVMRIKTLTSLGVLVPELIVYDDSWLLIKHAGTSIVDVMKHPETSQARKQRIFGACLAAIKNLHLENQYLSQAFIRNMLLHDERTMQVAFIDFEDDPLTVMNLPEAQARDLLLFVNSTARFFIEDVSFFNQSIQQFLRGHDPAMIKALRTTNSRMQWMTRVPFQKLLGHDYQKLKIGILALKHL